MEYSERSCFSNGKYSPSLRFLRTDLRNYFLKKEEEEEVRKKKKTEEDEGLILE